MAHSAQLRDHALVGRPAVLADLATIALMSAVVLVAHAAAEGAGEPWRDLYIPLIALGLGAAGAALAGTDPVGYLRRPGYIVVYAAVIALMIGVDLAVRAALGGDLLAVPAGWAALLGSASAVNLLVTRVPRLNVRRWIDPSSIARLHPVTMALLLLLQVAQAWISVLGAPWQVVVVQLLARRAAILVITHVLARKSYGAGAARLLRANATLEYVAVAAVASADGHLREPEPVARTVIGAMLLKLPIFAGEAMTAGRKSLARVGDKLLFVEQMLAFSSPTMVVSSTCAIGHVAFINAMLRLDGDPAAMNPRLGDPEQCTERVAEALSGRWEAFRAASAPGPTGGSPR